MQTHVQTQNSMQIKTKTMQMPPPGVSTVTYKIIGSSVKMLLVLNHLHPTSHLHFTQQHFWPFACPRMGSKRRCARVQEIVR